MTSPKIFLQGPPGVGKTTLLFMSLKALRVNYGGFVVKKVYAAGKRVAMDMVDLGLGHRARLVSFTYAGEPSVNLGSFSSVGVGAIRTALARAELVVMDELGRFELPVPDFLQAVFDALDSSVRVVGVIKEEHNPFLDAVRSRHDVKIIRMDHTCRDAAGARFHALLESVLAT